jgi:hypothetical protein
VVAAAPTPTSSSSTPDWDSTGTSDTVSVTDGSDDVVDGGLFDRTQG